MGNSGGRTVVGVLRGDGAVGFTVQSLANRYTSTGGHPIFHDDAGNLTVDKDGYKYFYDYENRVVKIQKPDGFGGWDDVAQMAYDTLGRRIRVIDSVASTTTLYYYNPEWQCLAEYSGAGTLQRYFVYGNYIDEPLVMHRQSDGEDYYYGQDHLYSTVVLLDDGGNVAERYECDAYGTVLVYTDDGNDDTWFTGDDTTASASAKGNPYTFTGRRLDVLDDGSLLRMHYRHRDYDTYTGRFVQHDPLQYLQNLSLYIFVSNMPTLYVDPLGLAKYTPWPVPGYSPFPGVPPLITPPDNDSEGGFPSLGSILNELSLTIGSTTNIPLLSPPKMVYNPPPVWLKVNLTVGGNIYDCCNARGLRETWGKGSLGIAVDVSVGGNFKNLVYDPTGRGSKTRNSETKRWAKLPDGGGGNFKGGVGNLPCCPKKSGCTGYFKLIVHAAAGVVVGGHGEITIPIIPAGSVRTTGSVGLVTAAEFGMTAEGGVQCQGPLGSTQTFTLDAVPPSEVDDEPLPPIDLPPLDGPCVGPNCHTPMPMPKPPALGLPPFLGHI